MNVLLSKINNLTHVITKPLITVINHSKQNPHSFRKSPKFQLIALKKRINPPKKKNFQISSEMHSSGNQILPISYRYNNPAPNKNDKAQHIAYSKLENKKTEAENSGNALNNSNSNRNSNSNSYQMKRFMSYSPKKINMMSIELEKKAIQCLPRGKVNIERLESEFEKHVAKMIKVMPLPLPLLPQIKSHRRSKASGAKKD